MRRRSRLLALAAAAVVAAAVVLIVIGSVSAAPVSIVGTWSGHLSPSRGSHASRQHFTFVVYRGERRGRWRAGPRCAGTLRLKDISNGYHHYYRVAGKHAGCVPPGIDCLERVGTQMVDVFVSDSGTANGSGEFRRVS